MNLQTVKVGDAEPQHFETDQEVLCLLGHDIFLFVVPITAAEKISGICKKRNDNSLPKRHEHNSYKSLH
jgi:hypothetical protein